MNDRVNPEPEILETQKSDNEKIYYKFITKSIIIIIIILEYSYPEVVGPDTPLSLLNVMTCSRNIQSIYCILLANSPPGNA